MGREGGGRGGDGGGGEDGKVNEAIVGTTMGAMRWFVSHPEFCVHGHRHSLGHLACSHTRMRRVKYVHKQPEVSSEHERTWHVIWCSNSLATSN